MMTWAQNYFEHGYALRWALGPPSVETRGDVKALWTGLNLSMHSRVLDLGCGHGRYAVALAEQNARVVGVDFASALLSQAVQLSARLRVRVNWVRADMRQVPIRAASMDGAILLDSFGFFEFEGENDDVLRELGRVLIPGGRVVLKVVNREPILASFRRSDRETRGDMSAEISRSLLSDPPRMIEHITLHGPEGSHEFERHQRLYSPAELVDAVTRAGLRALSISATIDGAAFESGRSRSTVILAERPL